MTADDLTRKIADLLQGHLLYGEWDFDDALECGCKKTWHVADFDEGSQLDRAHAMHVAEQIAALVNAEKADAWDDGYMTRWADMARSSRIPNPYRS